jgi:peptidoglycan hydrolase-like protein with peptidoglycan-binding domain
VIYEIQDYLRNISYYNEKVPFIASDGIYGEETREAVRVFQQIYNLEDSGNVDFQTWKKLVEINESATQNFLQPFPVAPIDDSDLPLKQGDKGPFVKHVKLMLGFLSENHVNFEKQTDTDEFDFQTLTEIQRWQRVAFLPQTGEVDKQTWNMLSEYYTM